MVLDDGQPTRLSFLCFRSVTASRLFPFGLLHKPELPLRLVTRCSGAPTSERNLGVQFNQRVPVKCHQACVRDVKCDFCPCSSASAGDAVPLK